MKKLITGLAVATAVGGTILGGIAVTQVSASEKEVVGKIEKELKNILNGNKEISLNWEDKLDEKYGDDWDDILDKKYGDNWEEKFKAKLAKINLAVDEDDLEDKYDDKYEDEDDLDDKYGDKYEDKDDLDDKYDDKYEDKDDLDDKYDDNDDDNDNDDLDDRYDDNDND